MDPPRIDRKRTKFSPVSPADLQLLMEMGLVEINALADRRRSSSNWVKGRATRKLKLFTSIFLREER